ncbi:uncharacterized protein LOC120901597 [Anopheles arabiensis]|uniref:uncharacterized protein LOC120901597 n=1 Tax=Anopheles arabiensis TaxID=7173 RepID=UPI001AADEC98|nr:uncharacterized protein LOC120901597 [Anopheles arabiensis]XP_040165597.1 uncharacterized protein LOC120901597 [Anopheles arabiensis]
MVAIKLLRLIVLITMVAYGYGAPLTTDGLSLNIRSEYPNVSDPFANTAYNATQEAAQLPVPQVIEKYGSTLMNVFDHFQRWLEKPLQRMIKINQLTDISPDMLKKGSKHLKQTVKNSSYDLATLLEIIPLTQEPIVVETTEILSSPITFTVTQRTTYNEQVNEQVNSAALYYFSWWLITLPIVVASWI